MTEPSPAVVAKVEAFCERMNADPAKVHASGLSNSSTRRPAGPGGTRSGARRTGCPLKRHRPTGVSMAIAVS